MWESLRNILTAYAAHDPVMGYVQSMNFIAAFLLLAGMGGWMGKRNSTPTPAPSHPTPPHPISPSRHPDAPSPLAPSLHHHIITSSSLSPCLACSPHTL
jgi:hypothetical protein